MQIAKTTAKEMVLSAVITKADGTIIDLGTIQYWHKNPFKRLAFKVKQYLQRLFWRIKKWLHF